MIRLVSILFLLFALACQYEDAQQLPVLGPKKIKAGQTIIHPVKDFSLINHHNQPFGSSDCIGKIRVVDFFFLSCPTICPKVQQQMLRISNHFTDEPKLLFLSHSFDTKRDTVARLAQYAEQLELDQDNRWHFLTGNKNEIYTLATDYFNVIIEDDTAPGGFNHTGRIVLVDPKGYIRAFTDGTDSAAVDTFILSIKTLLREEN